MNDEDIKKLQEVNSRLTREQHQKFMDNGGEEILATKMQELMQRKKAEEEMALRELPDEIRDEIFMILQ